jgi:hypothetical protein
LKPRRSSSPRTWRTNSASFDKTAGRYRGLRCGQQIPISESDSGLLVRPEIARKQQEAETPPAEAETASGAGTTTTPRTDGDSTTTQTGTDSTPRPAAAPKRFHGTVALDPTRVGRDASRIADEVVAHLAGLMGSTVRVTLEIEAEIPSGAPEHVVRTVTENSRTLKFTSHGFEKE